MHAHPPVATAFGVAGRDFMDAVLPEVIFHLGSVPLVPFALPGTPALGDAMAPFLADHDAFLLASHGATTVGPSLRLAHQRMESLEHAARILHAASHDRPGDPRFGTRTWRRCGGRVRRPERTGKRKRLDMDAGEDE